MEKIVGIIPARYKSSRFPGKPLADIHGKPMVAHVYENAVKVSRFERVLVATDDERIVSVCNALGIPSMMTGTNHKTGTDRLAEVAQKIEADYYVNIQGDEPLLSTEIIEKALLPISGKDPFDVVNLMTRITDTSDLVNSTVPKVVVNARNEAVFFSRAPIPYPKNKRPVYFKQVCVYVFKKDALKKFGSFEQGPVEQAEDIEILRFLENRMIVKMVEIDEPIVAVDTPADLDIVREIMAQRG